MTAIVHTEAMTATQRRAVSDPIVYPRHLEISTMELWLSVGTIWQTDRGEENSYFTDEFGNEFYCKCSRGDDDAA